MSDSFLGIPSQCVAAENLGKQKRGLDQYCANLAMKVRPAAIKTSWWTCVASPFLASTYVYSST